MEEILKKLAEHFGLAAPFGYAALAYGFFFWLDKELSDEAKAALARTMNLKGYKNEQIASALVEVFDRIYTYPLLRWRAFGRSLLFTTVVTAIVVFEFTREFVEMHPSYWKYEILIFFISGVTPPLLFNVLSDYLSLFVIRPLLVRSGTKPVTSLVLGALSGLAIVLAFNLLRSFFLYVFISEIVVGFFDAEFWRYSMTYYALPAMAVFVWLPLFALGIVVVRSLSPLSWMVGRTQWFLKEGKEHPLKAIGYVAAVVVFLDTVAVRAVFGA